MHYRDLLNAAGEIDRAMVRRIARDRARVERDIAICHAMDWSPPRSLRLSEVNTWRREVIARHAPADVVADANRRYRKTYAAQFAAVREIAEAMKAHRDDQVIDRVTDNFREFVAFNSLISARLTECQQIASDAITVLRTEHARWGELMKPQLVAAE